MNKLAIVNNLSRAFHKVGFQIKKHSPEILAVAGTVGTVAGAVMACKATTKLSTILDETKNNVEFMHESAENGYVVTKDGTKVEYTHDDEKKDLTIVYAQTGVKIAKLYAPAVIVGALSIGALLTSNGILRNRNLALAAAYTAVDKSFKDYRGRVVERFGKELDKELRHNIKATEIEEVVVNEDGTESKVKSIINVGTESEYAKFFDEYCPNWTKDAEYNLSFLKMQQAHANNMLQLKGYLFLNEVYDMLGLPRTKAGQVVGWVYDETNPIGDNCVDFGIYDLYNEQKRDFVNGRERSILLDFNVDGNILDMMR